MVAALLGTAAAATVLEADADRTVAVTDTDGRILARVPLEAEGIFSLRYRNSLYGTEALERFVAADDGSFRLRQLGAEQLAVLEEYYAVNEAPRRAATDWWTSAPAYELELDQLRIAATDLGRRTLLVEGRPPVDLWRLVEDAAPTIIISVEEP
ncbi:MAG: hypothetical protein ACRDGB_07240 [Candidatus Limnocylindria bacterium]